MNQPLLHIEGLRKSFGRNAVLQGVDLAVERGRLCAVLGPNGSGKTTLIKSLLGLVIPDGGRIRVEDRDVRGRWTYRERLDYLPQIARFPENLRVRELIDMVKGLRRRPARDEELIARFGLEPFLGQRMGRLSGGTRQKVNLVASLMFDSPCVVLDEPTSGLDPLAMIQLKDLMREERERGKATLFSTHIMDFVEDMADELVFLLEGRIRFRGSVDDLLDITGRDDVEGAIAALLRGPGERPFHPEPADC